MPAAVRFHRHGGPEVLVVDDVERPAPGAEQVRVAVIAAGVNPVEWKIRRGDLAEGEPLTGPRGLGTDIAGRVDAVGAGVVDLHPGDAVLGRARGGGYAEYALADRADLVARPPALPWDVAASVAITGETAFRMLATLGVVPPRAMGATVLVHGASGGVGSIAAQLAVLRGARVLGTAGPARHERLRRWGVEPVAHGDGWARRVRELAPAGVDAVLDTVGRGVLAESVALAGRPGSVLTIADRDAPRHGVAYSRGMVTRVPMAEVFAELLPAMTDGRIEVPIALRLPLAAAAQAHRVSELGHPGGRIVLQVREG